MFCSSWFVLFLVVPALMLYLSLYFVISLSMSIYLYLPTYLSMSVCLSIYLSIYLLIYLSLAFSHARMSSPACASTFVCEAALLPSLGIFLRRVQLIARSLSRSDRHPAFNRWAWLFYRFIGGAAVTRHAAIISSLFIISLFLLILFWFIFCCHISCWGPDSVFRLKRCYGAKRLPIYSQRPVLLSLGLQLSSGRKGGGRGREEKERKREGGRLEEREGEREEEGAEGMREGEGLREKEGEREGDVDGGKGKGERGKKC